MNATFEAKLKSQLIKENNDCRKTDQPKVSFDCICIRSRSRRGLPASHPLVEFSISAVVRFGFEGVFYRRMGLQREPGSLFSDSLLDSLDASGQCEYSGVGNLGGVKQLSLVVMFVSLLDRGCSPAGIQQILAADGAITRISSGLHKKLSSVRMDVGQRMQVMKRQRRHAQDHNCFNFPDLVCG